MPKPRWIHYKETFQSPEFPGKALQRRVTIAYVYHPTTGEVEMAGTIYRQDRPGKVDWDKFGATSTALARLESAPHKAVFPVNVHKFPEDYVPPMMSSVQFADDVLVAMQRSMHPRLFRRLAPTVRAQATRWAEQEQQRHAPVRLKELLREEFMRYTTIAK